MTVTCEIAHIRIRAELTEEFLTGIVAGAAVIAEQPGCHDVRVMQCLEDPQLFLLFADWRSVEDHMRFRESAAFGDYRSAVQTAFAAPPSFQHFRTVVPAPNGTARN